MQKRLTIAVIALISVINLAVWAQDQPEPETALKTDWGKQVDLLIDIRSEIVGEYVEEPDQQAMIEAAVNAMIGTLKDPYTSYLPPREIKHFNKAIRGSFSGIGAQINVDEGQLRIVTPLEDSPAWKAGILAGDAVLEIDGKSTEGITVNQAVERLTGPEGTPVRVKVRHEDGKTQEITIIRARINIQTVKGFLRGDDQKWDYMIDPKNKIGYVRLTQFTQPTAGKLRAALKELKDQGAKGVILDLRFNGGGLLTSAQQVSDMFLPADKRIVSIKGRKVNERVLKSSDDGTVIDHDVPVVVLANEGSASASEIVTGALHDNGRAKFIGTRTFGKGSVQQVKMLDVGLGALKITNAYYYLPSGRNIHRRESKETWGVDPDDGFYVPMDVTQVREMIEKRRDIDVLRKDGPQEGGDAAVTPESIRKDLADPQLAAGLEAMLGKLKTGDWPKVGKGNADDLAKETRRAALKRQRDLVTKRLEEIDAQIAKLERTDDAIDGTIVPEKSDDDKKPDDKNDE